MAAGTRIKTAGVVVSSTPASHVGHRGDLPLPEPRIGLERPAFIPNFQLLAIALLQASVRSHGTLPACSLTAMSWYASKLTKPGFGSAPRLYSSHIVRYCFSSSWTSKGVLKSKLDPRPAFSFFFSRSRAFGFRPNSMARPTYALWSSHTSSPTPAALTRLVHTLEAKPCPRTVSTGTPIHIASDAVVCAPYGKVSRNKSASA